MNSDRQTEAFQTGFLQQRRCPVCNLLCSSTVTVCPQDGTELVDLPREGRILAEKYEFIGEIGSGGMGVIYKARQMMLNKIVAIKMLHRLDDQSLRRFQQEAKASSTLQHPNIISVLDFGVTEQGQPYMVMDYVEGVTLSQIIQREGPLSVNEASELFLQICEGMTEAHKHQILHRDLKTSNIMLAKLETGKGQVKILDFGIAKLNDPELEKGLTATGEVFGSPLYMSPEQAMGKKVDLRTDVYSFGCIMFETLTGMTPFSGTNAIETIFKQINDKPPSLKEATLGKNFNAALEEVVATCLAKDPDHRYANMEELKQALLYASGKSVQPVRKKKVDQDPAPVSKDITGFDIKHASLILAAVALCCGLIFWGSITLLQSHQHEPTGPLKPELLLEHYNDDPNNPHSMARRAEGPADPTDPAAAMIEAPDVVAREALSHYSKGILDIERNDYVDEVLSTWKTPLTFKEVHLRKSVITGKTLHKLMSDRLRFLDLTCAPIDDKALKDLAKAPHLEHLDISETKISDTGLVYLTPLHELRELDLSKLRNITTKGIQTISSIKSLEFLDLQDCKGVTDSAIDPILKLQNLSNLDLGYTNITDKGAMKLTALKKLTELNLEGMGGITDASIEKVATLPLQSLNLSHLDNLTPRSLEALGKCSTLQELKIKGCKNLKRAVVAAFKQAHPNIKVEGKRNQGAEGGDE